MCATAVHYAGLGRIVFGVDGETLDGLTGDVEANRDRPFFAYVTTNAPHGPYRVPDSYREMYADADISDKAARFYGMITNIDDNLGRLRKRLQELQIEQDTILVFLTDNGSAVPHFNAGMRGRKGSMYEGGHRVPCFIRSLVTSRQPSPCDLYPHPLKRCRGLKRGKPGFSPLFTRRKKC